MKTDKRAVEVDDFKAAPLTPLHHDQGFVPAPEVPEDYYVIAQSRSSNTLARKLTTKFLSELQMDLFGTGLIETADFKLSVRGYNELKSGINISAAKLLDILVIKSTSTGLTDTLVRLPLKEFMEMRGLRDEKEARKQIKRDMDALDRVQFDYKGIGKNKNSWFKVSLSGGFSGIVNGVIHYRFNEEFYRSLRVDDTKYLFMYFPMEALKIADNHHPYSYHLARKISEHKRMNKDKPNEDVISVITLLNACVNMPDYAKLGEAKQVSLRIIEPFERDMDALSSTIQWEYIGAAPKGWAEFREAKLHITWVRYPDFKLKKSPGTAKRLRKENALF